MLQCKDYQTIKHNYEYCTVPYYLSIDTATRTGIRVDEYEYDTVVDIETDIAVYVAVPSSSISTFPLNQTLYCSTAVVIFKRCGLS